MKYDIPPRFVLSHAPHTTFLKLLHEELYKHGTSYSTQLQINGPMDLEG